VGKGSQSGQLRDQGRYQHLTFWQERARKHRRDLAEAEKKGRQIGPFVEPFLWIVTAGRPTSVLKIISPEPAAGWPEGGLLLRR
jgi:hypothetical protein